GPANRDSSRDRSDAASPAPVYRSRTRRHRVEGAGTRPTAMNVKKIAKGPWIWIVNVAIVVLLVLNLSSSADGFKEVKTHEMVEYFDDGKLKDVTFVEFEQEIRGTLKGDQGQKVRASWLGDQGDRLIQAAEEAEKAGDLTSFDVEVPKSNP